ncbi:hypothetical protein, partial [Sporomusa sphaeroides]|uniref:hypothetical protein n=1 Tax=Sporomusa sphaeroides TaxID=47679 RepID=UPI002B9091E6
APALQAGCRQFDPVIAHHRKASDIIIYLKLFCFLLVKKHTNAVTCRKSMNFGESCQKGGEIWCSFPNLNIP